MSAIVRDLSSAPARGIREEDLEQAINACLRAARGDLEVRLEDNENSPVITRLHSAINDLLDTTDAFVRESAASLEHVSRDSFGRRVLERGLQGSFRHGARIINAATKKMGERSRELSVLGQHQVTLASRLEETVGALANHVASAAHELEVSIVSLEQSAERTANGANEGSHAVDRARAGVVAVVHCTDELRTEITSISERTTRSSQIAERAVDGAKRTVITAEGVAEASHRISTVVKLISGVAEQTKLLALNAAIEAARAGEAGKGFGVVASEVKLLAGEAAQATGDIANQISSIQAATTEAVGATRTVVATIEELYAVADAINRAVETQTKVSESIVRSVADAEEGTSVLTRSVSTISDAANATRQAVGDLRGAAASLAELASKLTGEVSALASEIRAASTKR